MIMRCILKSSFHCSATIFCCAGLVGATQSASASQHRLLTPFGGEDEAPAATQSDSAGENERSARTGAVYVLSNQADANRVLVFDRLRDGSLAAAGSAPTGGFGTGSGLGGQGALTLSRNRQWLFAVSAGSDELSVFRVGNDGLTLTDIAASGGDQPISVTSVDGLVYVLNAGGAGNIAGFTLSEDGRLTPIAGSTRPLSGAAVTGPAQIQFDPAGEQLLVTEKMTNL